MTLYAITVCLDFRLVQAYFSPIQTSFQALCWFYILVPSFGVAEQEYFVRSSVKVRSINLLCSGPQFFCPCF